MAKKEKTAAAPVSITMKAIPDGSLARTRLYSNFVQIQNTPHDITLRFCDITPIYDTSELAANASSDGIVNHRVPIVAEIVLPYRLVPSLVASLHQKIKEFQDTYAQDSSQQGKVK